MAKTLAALCNYEFWKTAAELATHRDQSIALPVDVLTSVLPQGLSRGSIAEVCGPRSSGCASLCLQILAAATSRGEVCAVIDTHNRFDPYSADAAGLVLDRLVWVRCGGNPEAALRACDLLLHAGGLGVLHLDLCETSPFALNKIPLSYWHRFRRAVEPTPSILLISAATPQAKSCATFQLHLKMKAISWEGDEPFSVLHGRTTALALSKTPSKPVVLFWRVA